MAEALAIVGIVASIAQLVELGSKVLERLNDFHSSLEEVPETFRHIKNQLPLLLNTLEETQKAADAGHVTEETQDALLPVVQGCRSQVELLENVLIKTLPATGDSSWRKSRKAFFSVLQERKIEQITKALEKYIQSLTNFHATTSSALQLRQKAKGDLIELARRLSAPDPSFNYAKALRQRQEGTGSWFLESKQYADWKTDPASFLWLHGIPGCGKTILSATVIEDVLKDYSNDPTKVAAYFYFDFNNPQMQSSEQMIRSLIAQLCSHCDKVPRALEYLLSSRSERGQQLTTNTLMEALHQMAEDFSVLFVLLDALDECKNRVELLQVLEEFAGWSLSNLHIVVTSRKEKDIEESLTDLANARSICIQTALVDKDIRKYVRHRLQADRRFKMWRKKPEVQKEIETTLMGKAHGMFQWASCQLDELAKCINLRMLRKSLTELPRTLDDTYDRILRSIDDKYSEYALRILQWLAFSERPLRLEEIAEIVAIDVDGDPPFHEDEVLEDPSHIVTICSSLITIATEEDDTESDKESGPGLDYNSNIESNESCNENIDQISNEGSDSGQSRKIVRLVHYSVKEYLVSERIQEQGRAAIYSIQEVQAHAFIAESCLAYLSRFNQPDSITDVTIAEFHLARYAAEFWFKHAQAAETVADAMNRRIVECFLLKHDILLNWIRIFDIEMPWRGPDTSKKVADVCGPFYHVSMTGLSAPVKLLMEAGEDVNGRGGVYGNALQAASYQGYGEVVERLLEVGADVGAQGGQYSSALQAASAGGHVKVVERLLEAGVDVNAQGGEYGSALQAASLRGDVKVVERLLEAGADVNAQGGEYGSALQAASYWGNLKVVERLLEAGADVNVQGGEYGSALQAASYRGYIKVVERTRRAENTATRCRQPHIGVTSRWLSG